MPLAEIAGGMFDVLRRHGLRTRAESFTLVRALTILDGVLRELDPTLDPLRAATPYILRATVTSGDLVPAASLAGSLIRARWSRSPRLRIAVASASAAAVLITAAALWTVLV